METNITKTPLEPTDSLSKGEGEDGEPTEDLSVSNHYEVAAPFYSYILGMYLITIGKSFKLLNISTKKAAYI